MSYSSSSSRSASSSPSQQPPHDAHQLSNSPSHSASPSASPSGSRSVSPSRSPSRSPSISVSPSVASRSGSRSPSAASRAQSQPHSRAISPHSTSSQSSQQFDAASYAMRLLLPSSLPLKVDARSSPHIQFDSFEGTIAPPSPPRPLPSLACLRNRAHVKARMAQQQHMRAREEEKLWRMSMHAYSQGAQSARAAPVEQDSTFLTSVPHTARTARSRSPPQLSQLSRRLALPALPPPPLPKPPPGFPRLQQETWRQNRWALEMQEVVLALYRARCLDAHAGVGRGRKQQRFLARMLPQLRQGRLQLPSSHLHINSAKVLLQLLSTPLRAAHHLSAMPSSFVYIDLARNHLGDNEIMLLAAALSRLNSLRHLDMSGNPMTGRGVAALCSSCEVLPELTWFDLSSAPNAPLSVGPDSQGTIALANMLARSRSLRTLKLNELGLGRDDVTHLSRGVAKSGLHTLELEGNRINDDCVPPLLEALSSSPPPALNSLSFSRNNLTSLATVAFSPFLRNQHTLTCLDLSFNNIDHKGWLLLSDALSQSPSIENLKLDGNVFSNRRRGNSILDASSHAINEAMKRLTHLRGRQVSPKFQHNYALRSISLSRCGLGDAFVSALAEALTKCRSIQDVKMGWNNIKQEGAESLANLIKNNKSMHSLDLQWNGVNDVGGQSLGRALLNSNLVSLNLQNNDIGESAASLIFQALAARPSLTSVNIDNNRVPYASYCKVAETRSKNERYAVRSQVDNQKRTVEELQRSEVRLHETQQEIENKRIELEFLTQKLADLEANRLTFFKSEAAVNDALDEELKTVFTQRHEVNQADYDCEREMKRVKQAWEVKMESMKKQRDVMKEQRVAAQKECQKLKQQVLTNTKEQSLDFAESDRLLIVIQSNEKRNKATVHLIAEHYARLAEWIKALEKRERDAKKGVKEKSNEREPNLMSPLLSPDSSSLPARATPQPMKKAVSTSSSGKPAKSPAAPASTTKSSKPSAKGTLLRPAPGSVEPINNGIVWSEKASTNKASPKRKKKAAPARDTATPILSTLPSPSNDYNKYVPNDTGVSLASFEQEEQIRKEIEEATKQLKHIESMKSLEAAEEELRKEKRRSMTKRKSVEKEKKVSDKKKSVNMKRSSMQSSSSEESKEPPPLALELSSVVKSSPSLSISSSPLSHSASISRSASPSSQSAFQDSPRDDEQQHFSMKSP